MKTRYIFGASLPRSGTKLYTYALSTNKKIMMASNPNIELFKFLKNLNNSKFGFYEINIFLFTLNAYV